MTQPAKDPKGKFQEWENMLVGKDMHSIRNQIYDMIWDCAFFQCINESRRYAAKDDKGNIKRNGPLHSFVNQSFFKTQLLSVRNLTDKDFNRVQEDRPYTVYSLYNLIEDMKKNGAILTRKNILAAYNLPYDYKRARAEFDKNTGYKKGPVIDPIEIGHSEDIHRQIDSVAGVTTDGRSADDLVLNANSFRCFDDWLKSSQELYVYVNKYIAHSSTPESRRGVSDEIEEALRKIFNAHKIICETASFIGNKILFCGFGYVLPIPRYGPYDQFDVFEYLDEPIASKETTERLRNRWEEYRRETELWNQC
jgi:hypothetical protein